MNLVLAIAGGGALGALLRYYTQIAMAHLFGSSFPWGTLTVNVLGSFLLGIVFVLFSSFEHLQQELRVFLMIGLLGAFTTFSTFSLDVFNLWEQGAYTAMAGYIVASVMCSIGGLMVGAILMRQILA